MQRCIWGILGCCASLFMATRVALAQSTQLPPLQITMGSTPQAGDLAIPLQILLLLTLLSFIPALLIAMTSFTRIVPRSRSQVEPCDFCVRRGNFSQLEAKDGQKCPFKDGNVVVIMLTTLCRVSGGHPLVILFDQNPPPIGIPTLV